MNAMGGIQQAVDRMKELAGQGYDKLKAGVEGLRGQAPVVGQAMADKAGPYVKAGIEAAGDLGAKAGTAYTEAGGLKGVSASLGNKLAEGWDSAKQAFGRTSAYETGSALGDTARNAAAAAKNTAAGFAEGLAGAPSSAAEGGAQSVVESARRAVATGMQPSETGLRSSAGSEAARAAGPATEPTMGARERVGQLSKWVDNAPGLRGVAARAGRAAGPVVAPLMETYNAAQNVAAGENPLKAAGRGVLRTAGGILGGVAGATAGTLAGPVGTVAGGVAGGVGGYELADKASERIFGKDPSSDDYKIEQMLRGAPAKPGAQRPATATPQPQADYSDGYFGPGKMDLRSAVAQSGSAPFVDTTRGERVTPDQLIDGKDAQGHAHVPASGQGAFRIGKGPAAALGGPAPVQVATPAKPAQSEFERDYAAQGLRTASFLEGQRTTRRGQDLTHDSNVAARNLQAAQLGHTLGNEAETRLNKRVEDYVKGKAEVANPGWLTATDAPARAAAEAKVKQQTSDLSERLRHTMSVTGQNASNISEPQQSLLLKANDFRERLADARNTKQAYVQDFFGNDRRDSKNLYSYLPKRDKSGAVEPAVPGPLGYSVRMGNGNQIKVYQVAGGGFNLTGPNDPVDADAMELIQPAIDAAQKSGRK